jgi:hypothetical protein
MIFYPEYQETDKYYEVKFYDANGKILLQDGKETWSVKYNEIYDGPVKNFLYKDDSGLADNLRYTFLGWSGIDYGDRDVFNAEHIDLSEYRIKNSITLYPHFTIQDVHEEATSMEYFQIKDGVISLREEYLGVLQGKITLPSDSRVVAIGTMSTREKPAQFTHVYTLSDNIAYAVNSSAFGYARQLKIVELP